MLHGILGLNVHLDTPTEILHTVLLGVVKYFWAQTIFLLEKSKSLEVFQMRLQSLGTDGLNAPSLNAEYICRYKGSLIGKHFKSIAQVMPFLVYDLVPSVVLDAWYAIGQLVVLLWHTSIQDTEEYLVSCSSIFTSISSAMANPFEGGPIAYDRRSTKPYLAVRSQHPYLKTQVSLSYPPPRIHPPVWAFHSLLHGALRKFQPRVPPYVHIQQPPGP